MKKHLIKVIFEGKLVQPDIELAFSRIPSASGRRHNPATDINTQLQQHQDRNHATSHSFY